MKPTILCFGEMLWDIFPDGAVPGGAPLNVALGLGKLGSRVRFLSACGNDEAGDNILRYLHENGLSTDLIQRNEYPTGIVKVTLSENRDASYEIVYPSAWDFFRTPEKLPDFDVLVYGSLACRNKESFDTLQQLLERPSLKIFDVNLRPPHIDRATIEFLMERSDVVKMNEDELSVAGKWLGLDSGNREKVMDTLMEHYDIKTLCITLGREGALLKSKGVSIRQHGFQIQTGDTVGAGDAFLAGFIHQFVRGNPLKESLEFACRLGAYVASKKGANPDFSPDEIKALQLRED
jgi:fructokinase